MPRQYKFFNSTSPIQRLSFLLAAAAEDEHGHVRIGAGNAASYLAKEKAEPILASAKAAGLDNTPNKTQRQGRTAAPQQGFSGARERPVSVPKYLKGNIAKLFRQGAEIYSREAHCGTRHQPNGAGLPAAGFPPLAGSEWVLKDEERLIKLTLALRPDRSQLKGLSTLGKFQ